MSSNGASARSGIGLPECTASPSKQGRAAALHAGYGDRIICTFQMSRCFFCCWHSGRCMSITTVRLSLSQRAFECVLLVLQDGGRGGGPRWWLSVTTLVAIQLGWGLWLLPFDFARLGWAGAILTICALAGAKPRGQTE